MSQKDTRPRGPLRKFLIWRFRNIFAHGMIGGGWDGIEIVRPNVVGSALPNSSARNRPFKYQRPDTECT